MRCPSCGHGGTQAGLLCSRCGEYIPKSAAARAAVSSPDSESDDEELYEAPERPSQRLRRLAFRAHEFNALPERQEVRPFILRAVGFGALIGVGGLALGLGLLAAEEWMWSSSLSPGTHYPSFIELFMLPAFYGWMMAFSGLFRSLRVVWPWLDSPSVGAWFARLGVALVLLLTTGLIGVSTLWTVANAVFRALAKA